MYEDNYRQLKRTLNSRNNAPEIKLPKIEAKGLMSIEARRRASAQALENFDVGYGVTAWDHFANENAKYTKVASSKPTVVKRPAGFKNIYGVDAAADRLRAKMQDSGDVNPFQGLDFTALEDVETEYMFNEFRNRLGLTSAQSAALVGNADYETGTFKFQQEIGDEEYLKGGRGGYGLFQFTGPRRIDFEKFVKENNLPLDDYKSGVEFAIYEFTKGGEKKQLARLKNAESVEEASDIVAKNYLRPKKETANYSERQRRSKGYYDAYSNLEGPDKGELNFKSGAKNSGLMSPKNR